VHNRTVAHRNSITDVTRYTGVSMDTNQVLNVGEITYMDTVRVAAKYRAK
jgi:hypothetical protein